MAHGEVQSAHELVDVVKAQRTPSVALAWLHHYVGACQGCFKGILVVLFPVFLAAIEGSHIVDIGVCNLLTLFPAVATHHHSLYARAVIAVHTAENALQSQLAGFLGRHSLLGEVAFCRLHTD